MGRFGVITVFPLIETLASIKTIVSDPPETRLVLETRLLLEPPGSPMNMYRVGQKSDTSRTLHYIVREVSLFWPTLCFVGLFKTPRFLVLYLLLQSEISGRQYRRSANHTIRTNDAMHHNATGDVQLAL